jgi:hypothetical protein
MDIITGKSVMCSYIRHALSQTKTQDICYYMCNSQDGTKACHRILKTIALQLLKSHQDLASLICHEFVYAGATSVMAQLKVLIPKLLETVPYVSILVDGLDECPIEGQKAALQYLLGICNGKTSHCKVLFSSRKEVYITEKLHQKPQISLDGRKEVELDIRLYVKHQILKLETSNQNLLKKIESILVEKANGKILRDVRSSGLIRSRDVSVGSAGRERIATVLQ